MAEFYVCNESTETEDFVSIAANYHKGDVMHAAIIIRYKNINYLHHYPGYEDPVVKENAPSESWGVFSILRSIETEDEVGAVLAWCRRICAQSNIKYEFTLNNSYYNQDGNYVEKEGLPETGTCVGFCLSTLNTILPEANRHYIELTDWDYFDGDTILSKVGRTRLALQYPRLDWNTLSLFRKRMTPLEYFCTSFITKYPIRKTQLSKITSKVNAQIIAKFEKSDQN